MKVCEDRVQLAVHWFVVQMVRAWVCLNHPRNRCYVENCTSVRLSCYLASNLMIEQRVENQTKVKMKSRGLGQRLMMGMIN